MELLTNELGQPVKVLEKVENFALPSSAENEGAYLYMRLWRQIHFRC